MGRKIPTNTTAMGSLMMASLPTRTKMKATDLTDGTVRSMSHPTVATTRKNTDTSTSPLYTRPNLMWRGCRTGLRRIKMLHFMLTLGSAILLLNFINSTSFDEIIQVY